MITLLFFFLSLLIGNSSGGTLLPPPYGAYPYIQTPQVLPATVTAAATAALNPANARVPASYYHPIIYWPYPSPPVSPTTYYAHSGPTMVKIIMRGLPYNASANDVVQFFNGWEVSGCLISLFKHILTLMGSFVYFGKMLYLLVMG